jgi:hypothetical protein
MRRRAGRTWAKARDFDRAAAEFVHRLQTSDPPVDSQRADAGAGFDPESLDDPLDLAEEPPVPAAPDPARSGAPCFSEPFPDDPFSDDPFSDDFSADCFSDDCFSDELAALSLSPLEAAARLSLR